MLHGYLFDPPIPLEGAYWDTTYRRDFVHWGVLWRLLYSLTGAGWPQGCQDYAMDKDGVCPRLVSPSKVSLPMVYIGTYEEPYIASSAYMHAYIVYRRRMGLPYS